MPQLDRQSTVDAIDIRRLAADASESALRRFQDIVRRVVSRGDDQRSLVQEIACVVGAEILGGNREPGSDLNSVELARRFKTSRTPTREALVVLEKEGLVEILPRRRPRVAALSSPLIHEIYHVRATLLGLVASEAVFKATVQEIADLRLILVRMKRAAQSGDVDAYFWENVTFHDRLVDLSHNKTLREIIEALTLRSIRLRRLTLSNPERMKRSVADHFQLMNALEDRDSELAAAQAKSNVLGALKVLQEYLQSPN